jgi:hypothetical protein
MFPAFGCSPVYAALVAWAQIVGAALLGFRRTALIGALVLLPIMINIVFIDLWVVRFPWESGALQNAFYVLLALLVTVSFHGADLFRFLQRTREDLAVFDNARLRAGVAAGVVMLAMIAYTAHEGYWLANVNNRDPTPLDGAWEVQGTHDGQIPSWIYFEYNRAYMVVFRYADGKSETHDFRVGDGTKTIAIGEDWLTPGTSILKGNWSRAGDTMSLTGVWKGEGTISLTLHRKSMRIKDHQ